MKKIYLMGLSAMCALAVNAQNTIKIKNTDLGRKTKIATVASANKVASPSQITGGITCATQYVAGTTMDLVFTVLLTNTDSEYGDKITLTFPTGITPNTSASNTPTVGTGAAYIEALNGVVGQSISWGDDDNVYGGIVPNTSYSLQVNVTIGAAVTGTQGVTYDVSGDTYGAAPGDLIGGECIVNPFGATVIDVKTTNVYVLTSPTTATGAQNCALATQTVAAIITNIGNTIENNVPINYSVNGVASTLGSYPGPLNPGDTVLVGFPMPYDFSAQGIYSVKAWSAVAGDLTVANDTAVTSVLNSVPVALTSNTYTNGFENVYDQTSFASVWAGSGLPFGLSATAKFGTRGLFYTVNMTTVGAPAGTYETMNIMPCTDVVAGDIYRISFWKKCATSGTLTVNGQTGVFSGLAQDFASMTDILKPYSALTPTSTPGAAGWVKDSVDYTATASETRYFAVGGKGTLTTTADQINVRLDEIKISKIGTVSGIKTNTAALENVSIFPNPSTGILNINTIDATTSVEIFNVIGEKIYSSKNLNKGINVVDLSNLANGSYFVKMSSNNNVTTKKVVLSK